MKSKNNRKTKSIYHTCLAFTRVGYDEVASLVVKGAMGGAGRVPRARQALVAKVYGVAVIQQCLSDLKSGIEMISTVTQKPSICLLVVLDLDVKSGCLGDSADFYINMEVNLCSVWFEGQHGSSGIILTETPITPCFFASVSTKMHVYF